jgi:alpha-soluble NSF attachment protein
MGDHVAKANEQLKKAEKKLASWQFFGNKYEEAAELLEKVRATE